MAGAEHELHGKRDRAPSAKILSDTLILDDLFDPRARNPRVHGDSEAPDESEMVQASEENRNRPTATRYPELAKRDFAAIAPNQLWEKA